MASIQPDPKPYVPPVTGIDEHTIEERQTEETRETQEAVPKPANEPASSAQRPIQILRVRNRSRQLHKSFHPVLIFLQLLGRFPFDTTLKVDGTIGFKYKKCSITRFLFLLTSSISVFIYTMFTIGIIATYLDVPPRSTEVNKCDQTWEDHALQQTMVPLLMTWTWLGLLAVGSVYEIFYGKELEYYYNYWHRAVQVMDMDVTYGVFCHGIRGNLEFLVICITFSVLYGLNILHVLHDTAAMSINCLIRWFYLDLYKGGQPPLLEGDYAKYLKGGSREGQIPPVFKESKGFQGAKGVGFLIMLYAMYGSRSFIIQFGFFCRVLRNAAWIWNERFHNNLRKERASRRDQTKHRMEPKVLLKDHLILVQLFKMTEENFGVVLQFFYLVKVLHLVLIVYAFSLLTTITECHEYWENVKPFNCQEYANWTTNWRDRVTFKNPRVSDSDLTFQNTIVVVILFVQGLFLLFNTTIDAAKTYEEAMRGWQIFRKHSFMSAETIREKNFMHSLNVSFARNNPLQISAGGYFGVNKELLVGILINVLIFFTVMLQFRPGEINLRPICNGSQLNIYEEDAYLQQPHPPPPPPLIFTTLKRGK